MVSEGEQAPDFELEDQDGNTVRLRDLRGQPVVVYFYPKADTPGCTTQACGIRDRGADYRRSGAAVLGVSPDEPAALRAFADKYSLDFTLLADVDHAAAEAYGVWVERSMYGRRFWGNERSTFIVDPDGRIARAFPKVQPKTHDDLILGALAAL